MDHHSVGVKGCIFLLGYNISLKSNLVLLLISLDRIGGNLNRRTGGCKTKSLCRTNLLLLCFPGYKKEDDDLFSFGRFIFSIWASALNDPVLRPFPFGSWPRHI
jgi:hypothetical protein